MAQTIPKTLKTFLKSLLKPKNLSTKPFNRPPTYPILSRWRTSWLNGLSGGNGHQPPEGGGHPAGGEEEVHEEVEKEQSEWHGLKFFFLSIVAGFWWCLVGFWWVFGEFLVGFWWVLVVFGVFFGGFLDLLF